MLTFSVDKNSTLGSVQILTLDVPSDFQLQASPTPAPTPSPCTAGTTNASCSVTITFAPAALGLRRGVVILLDSSNNPLIIVPIYGIGNGPMIGFSPSTASVVSTGSTNLNPPTKIITDGQGHLYVAPSAGASNVVKMNTDGTSATVVSTPGFTLGTIGGIALDGVGNLYIGDNTNNRIIVVTPGGTASPLIISNLSPALNSPIDLAFDPSGNLYIADSGDPSSKTSTTCPSSTFGTTAYCNRIVQVTLSGTATVLPIQAQQTDGTWQPYQFLPSTLTSLAVDAAANLYFVDRFGSTVAKLSLASPWHAAPLSTGNNIALNQPQGVAVDGMGNVYIADTLKNRIVMVTTAGVSSVVPTPGLATSLDLVSSVAVDPNGILYIADSGNAATSPNNRILKVDVTKAGQLTFAQGVVTSPNPTASVDSPQTATVTNLGNQPLTFNPNPSIAASDFAINTGDSSGCVKGTPVAAGATCDISVNFTPTQNGARSGNVSVTDNAMNASSPQQVPLSGTGVNASDVTALVLTATPSPKVTQAQTLTLSVTVTETTAPSTVPTGSVTFIDIAGSTAVSLNSGNAVPLDTHGTAVLSGIMLSGLGPHTIKAYYEGTTNTFEPSSSNANLTLTEGITFSISTPPPYYYGASIPLTATDSSGLQISYAITSGPASLNGTLLTVTGVGSVTVTATEVQPTKWTNLYPAPSQSVIFQATPAPLTITALNQNKTYDGNPFPTSLFTVSYGGFVNNENSSSLSGTLSYGGNAIGATNAGSYSITPQGLSATNYAITFQPGTLTINPAPLTVKANDAPPMVYGTSLPPFSGTVTGVISGDNITASYTTTATTTSPVGAYPITPVLNDPGGKLGNYTVTSTNGAFTITKAGSVTAVQTSAPAVLLKSNATFTARVTAATSGTPSGTVNFLDGTTTIGSATLDNTATASLTVSTLAAGAHSITAVYAGDTNFTGSTSSAVTESVQDFQFSINGTVANDAAVVSAVVVAGQIATYQFQLSPTGGTTFPSAVTLSLTGLPKGATYTIVPPSLVAGSGTQMVTVQVYTAKSTAGLRRRSDRFPLVALGWLLPMLGMVRLCCPIQGRTKRLALFLLLLLAIGMAGMAGCGGSSGSAHGSQTYTMQLNGTSGALQHIVTLSLTVQ
jgi:hypothetical protein